MKILVVDDDLAMRRMLEMLLGFEDEVTDVCSAATPSEALRMAEEFKPDAAVIDSMYGNDGCEVGHMLRQVLPGAHLISFSGLERKAAWADEELVKDGDALKALTKALFEGGV